MKDKASRRKGEPVAKPKWCMRYDNATYKRAVFSLLEVQRQQMFDQHILVEDGEGAAVGRPRDGRGVFRAGRVLEEVVQLVGEVIAALQDRRAREEVAVGDRAGQPALGGRGGNAFDEAAAGHGLVHRLGQLHSSGVAK